MYELIRRYQMACIQCFDSVKHWVLDIIMSVGRREFLSTGPLISRETDAEDTNQQYSTLSTCRELFFAIFAAK